MKNKYVQSSQQDRFKMSKMKITLNEYRSSYGLQYLHLDFRPLFLYTTKFSLFKSPRFKI